jgi:hypothetical protein
MHAGVDIVARWRKRQGLNNMQRGSPDGGHTMLRRAMHRARARAAGNRGAIAPGLTLIGALVIAGPCAALANEAQALLNRGQDPFFRISSAIAHCPEPLGPRIDLAAWQRETHHRLERGYRCHAEGRCRLSNAYHYDREIAETVQRRLQWLARQDRGWQRTSLWLTVSRRWLTIQGCVPPGFDPKPLVDALGNVEGVERVIVETTDRPRQHVPYRVYPGQ